MLRKHLPVFCLSLVFIFCGSITIFADVFTVTKTADTNDGTCDSDCSLREAVTAAGNFVADNIVLFSPSLSGSTITIGAPAIEIFGAKSLRIEGLGADRLTISGANSTGIFRLSNEGAMDLRIAGMTLTAGRNAQPELGGGAINSISGANIEIDHVNFVGNVMANPGLGGAIFLGGGGTHRISNSTFSGNTAASCGAISIIGGPDTRIVNSTFSGNTATLGDGGAICLSAAGGSATLRNLTISGNNARNGGAIAVANGAFNIGNSVLSGNTAVNFPEVRRQTNGIINSDGNNHIGDSAGDSASTDFPVIWAASDVLNTPPVLGGLQNNGGRIPTILPAKGSPLINTGSNALSAGTVIDERGFSRIAGGTVDKGAAETSSAATTVAVSGLVTSQAGRAIPGTYVTLTDMLGNTVKGGLASSGGYYSFPNTPAGDNYFVVVTHRRYSFPTTVISADADVFSALIGTRGTSNNE
jgi:CSLREA domain-containing protein